MGDCLFSIIILYDFLSFVIAHLSLPAFFSLLLLHSHGIVLVLRLPTLYASYSVCIFLSFLIYLTHDKLSSFNKIKLFRFFLKFPTNYKLSQRFFPPGKTHSQSIE